MIVVSKSSAITSLLHIGRLAILPVLNPAVIIPGEAAGEFLEAIGE
jgi:predicted nucleic acid-binding protein